MNLSRLFPSVLAALLACGSQAFAAPTDGVWEGKLQGAIRLRIHLKSEGGVRLAKLDSPDQGTLGLDVELRHLSEDSLSVWLASANGGWSGRISEDGSTLTGTWSQGGAAIPLTLTRLEAAPDDRKPQEPHPPYPYDVADVSFENAAASVTLAGTLTSPRGASKAPAAVLVSGSGPQDRDSHLLGHKPFKLLADQLTRAGIAVLRYDERGIGKSSGHFRAATTADFAADAAAAVAYLRTRSDIDGARIVVIGHSEGGLIAPWVAARDPKLAAIVSLAGPSIRGDALLEAQSIALMRAAGRDSAGQANTMEFNRKAWQYAFEDTPEDTLKARVARASLVFVASLPESERGQVGDAEQFARTTATQLADPWFRSFVRLDPGPDLARVRVPMLAYFAERDLQVPPDSNIPALHAHFKGPRANLLTVHRWPKLNHLFQTATTGLPAEYSLIPETMAPAMLDGLVAWLQTTMGIKR